MCSTSLAWNRLESLSPLTQTDNSPLLPCLPRSAQLRAALICIRFFCSCSSALAFILSCSHLSVLYCPLQLRAAATVARLDWGVSRWLMPYRQTINLSWVHGVRSKTNSFWLCRLVKDGSPGLLPEWPPPLWKTQLTCILSKEASAIHNHPDKEPPNWPLLSISCSPSTPYHSHTHTHTHQQTTEAPPCQHNEIRQRSLWRCIVLVHLWHHSHPTRPLHPFPEPGRPGYC